MSEGAGNPVIFAKVFINNLAPRLNNRVQISSNSLAAYAEAIKHGFTAIMINIFAIAA